MFWNLVLPLLVLAGLGYWLWRPTKHTSRASDSHTNSSYDRPKWSGHKADLPIKQLTRQQWDCLSDVSDVAPLKIKNDGGYTFRGEAIWAYNSRTVNVLLKHGMLCEHAGSVSITDKGLQALETLPVRH